MLTLDHVLIATDNLSDAKARCERLGFTVVYGGNEKSALNALIFLEDGTLIELIGKDRFSAALSLLHFVRLTRLFGLMIDRIAAFPGVPAGLFNISLHSPDLRATYDRLSKNGFAVDRPTRLRRKRDDGATIKWELLGTAPYDLPFIIGDYSPGRLSDEKLVRHANGAIGIANVTIGCRDLSRYVDLYSRMLDAQAVMADRDGVRQAAFQLPGSVITLVASDKPRRGFTLADMSFPLAFAVRHRRGRAGETIVEDVSIDAQAWVS